MTDEKHDIRRVICYGCRNTNFPVPVDTERNGKQNQLCRKCNPPHTLSQRYVWGVCERCQRKVVFNTQKLRWEHHDFDDNVVRALTGSDSEASGIGTVILTLAAGFLIGVLFSGK